MYIRFRACHVWTVIALALAGPMHALAHDSWLVADRYSAPVDETLHVQFITGEVFPIGDADTQLDRLASFNVAKQGRIFSIDGISQGSHSLGAPYSSTIEGLQIFGCVLKPRLITLESDKFDSYLRAEHADEAMRIRAERSPAGNVVEQYTKFAKTIVANGTFNPADESYLIPLGHRLEIIPLGNPLMWQAGHGAAVRVLLDGHPWPGVSISAGHDNAGAHAYAHECRTDAQGEATIPLSTGGLWFIKAHFIREAGPLDAHQWESFWATFTFPVGGTTAILEPTSAPALATADTTAGKDLTEDVRAIVAIHGELSPWAVLGYRMGQRALADLKLPKGSDRLLAIHRTPFEMPYTIVADGIQAATHTSLGRLTLLIAKVDLTDMRSEFMDRTGGGSVTLRIAPRVLEELAALKSPDDREAMALRLLVLTDDELFSAAKSEPIAPPADPTSLPTTRTADRSKEGVSLRAPGKPSASADEPNDPDRREFPFLKIRRVGLGESLVLACRTSRADGR